MPVTTPKQITIHVPYVFARRSTQKQIRIETPEEEPARFASQPIVTAIARAFRWRKLIEGGVYGSITELARANGINESYACRMLKLTLLPPRLIEAALDGRLPSTLTQRHLTKPRSALWCDHKPS